MKSIVVISDTHGRVENLNKIVPIINESDFLFFLGDGLRDISAFINEDKTFFVSGNCDGERAFKRAFVTVENVKFLLVHGDEFNVKSNLLSLTAFAKENDVDVVLFGHTHFSKEEIIDGIRFINVGSLSCGRIKNEYAYIVVCKDKVINTFCQIK